MVMRRITISSVACLALALLLAGCPWRNPHKNPQFTSAEGITRNGLYDGAVTTGTPEDGAGGDEVREVVEPDIIRRDGSLLYILNQYRGLSIVDLDSQEVLAQVPTFGFPRDLYLAGDRAYVLSGYAADYHTDDTRIRVDIGSRVYVVDVADPAQAAITGSFRLEGDFVDSRIVGDVLYAVSARYEWYWADSATAWSKQQSSESWVTSIDLNDPQNIQIVDELSLAGYGTVIQATNTTLFVAAPDWYNDTTAITCVDISDPAGDILPRGTVTVRGYVGDRFKMDVWNGVLRVVSNTSWRDRHVYITTVALSNLDAPAVLGETSLEGAAGETLFATRFDGPLGYIVTFLVVDPLFVLDFSEPAAPAVLGILEVPGWSTHIEPRGDRLIALGVDDTVGRQVCVSLFDVADSANPALLDRESFGDQWSWTTAYGDVKAFTILDDLIIVPFSGWSDQGGYERLQFLTWDRDSLTLHGHVDLQGQALRAFEYGGMIYSVTSEQLVTIDASDLAAPMVAHRLTLAENVTDFHEIAPDYGAEIILSQDSRAVMVRTVDNTGAPIGQVMTELGNCIATHSWGTRIALVATGWNDAGEGSYRVVIVECADPTAPEIVADIPVKTQPYWGWYWYYDIMPMRAAAEDSPGGKQLGYMMPWYWWPAEDTTFLAGNALALRCSGGPYDVQYGPSNPQQGLAVVDLETGVWTRTIGLGYEQIAAVNTANDKIYISTKEDAGSDLLGRRFCAWYLRTLDPNAPQMGPAVNVPGSFLQYDPATRVLLLEDQQYDGSVWNWRTRRLLRSVSWDGGTAVTPLSRLELSDSVGVLKARGARVYFDAYDQSYVLGSITVSPAGTLALGEKAQVTDSWAYLIDADGGSAYVVVNGGAVARYSFDGAPALAELQPVMNNPQRVRFGANNAYAPLGYAGLLVMGR